MNAEIVARLLESFEEAAAASESTVVLDQATQALKARAMAAKAGIALANAVGELGRLGFDEKRLDEWSTVSQEAASYVTEFLPPRLEDLIKLAHSLGGVPPEAR